MSIRFVTSPSVTFDRLREPALDHRRALRATVRAWREITAREFDRGAWAATGQRWPRKVPFGELSSGGPSRLQVSGKLRRAWLGGPGSFERVDEHRAVFGVDGARLPYAIVHRGGSGELGPGAASRVTRLRVTARMRAFLHSKGVHLRDSTRFLRIPARPHATVSPQLIERAREIFAAHHLGDSQ